MLEVAGLSYRGTPSRLLDDISLSLGAYEINAIIGPNGAGKSTLLQCLTGSLRRFSGTIRFQGADMAALTRDFLARRRAVLMQANALSFPVLAGEVVRMGRHPHGADNAEEIIDAALALVDARGLKARHFASLSGGEQQRCHLARVLAQIWDVPNGYLFLDEPTAALDFRHQYQLFEHLRRTADAQKIGVCFITHDMRLAEKYADRVIALKGGRLVGHWAANKCRAHLADIFDVPAAFLRDA